MKSLSPARWSAVVAITGIAFLAGCSQSADVPARPLPEKNLSQWTMPLDEYVYSYTIQSDYAEDLLTSPCMAEKGFDWAVPWRNLDALQSASYNSIGLRLFTVELASEFGYHVAPNTDPSAIARMEVVKQNAQISPEEDSALTACLGVARKTLPTLPLDAQNAANYSNDALDKARASSSVRKAATAWKTCMRPEGVGDLPNTPDEMPTSGLAQKFGLVGGNDSDSGVTAEEIQIATADAKCQESSGYKQALYDEEWRNQVETMHANADDLARIYDVLSENRKKVMDVIAENAPIQP